MVLGPAGTVKTYLACALAKAACAQADARLLREAARPGGPVARRQDETGRRAQAAREVRRARPARARRVTAEQARRPVQGDAARAHGAALRFILDHLLHAVQVEGLARQAGRWGSRRGDHGQDRARHRLAVDGGSTCATYTADRTGQYRRCRFTMPPVLSRNIRGTEMRKYSLNG